MIAIKSTHGKTGERDLATDKKRPIWRVIYIVGWVLAVAFIDQGIIRGPTRALLAYDVATSKAFGKVYSEARSVTPTPDHCAMLAWKITDGEHRWLSVREYDGEPIRNHVVAASYGFSSRLAMYERGCAGAGYVSDAVPLYRRVEKSDNAIRSLRDIEFHLPISLFWPVDWRSMNSGQAGSYRSLLSRRAIAMKLCMAKKGIGGVSVPAAAKACGSASLGATRRQS